MVSRLSLYRHGYIGGIFAESPNPKNVPEETAHQIWFDIIMAAAFPS
jgi:hypothetical protein